jgi:hypothetical protein
VWLIDNHNPAPILSVLSFLLEKFRRPSLSEALMEAAHAVEGNAIHI